MNQNNRRLVLLVAFCVLALFALRDFVRLGDALPWRTMDEFPDFYCAGWSLNHGASPYTYEPLRTCEHASNTARTFRGKLFADRPAMAVPAPQPPYDFVAFMALARLPVVTARVVYALAILLAVTACVVAFLALGVPLPLALAVLALSTGYASLGTGQIVPFALLALLLCGVALNKGRDVAAGIAAGLTAIEPTLGVATALAVLLFVPKARWALLATLTLLFGAGLAITGPANAMQYVTVVLPAHAASELHFPFQFSLTYLLAFLRVPGTIALIAGSLSYAVFVAVALWGAHQSSASQGRRELLVFVPAIGCVLGGAFVHQEELCFALPAVTILAMDAQGRARAAYALALCILSIPWIAVWGAKQLLLASLLVSATILGSLRLAPRSAVLALTAIAAALYGFELFPPHLPVPPADASHVYAPNDVVQTEWRDYTEQRSTRNAGWIAIKIPSWAALTFALVSLVRPRER